MKLPQRHRDTELRKSATDKHRFSPIRDRKLCSVSIRVNPWLIFGFCLCFSASVAIAFRTRAEQTSKVLTDAALEGCLKCHSQIEPMHRFGPTATLDKLDNGKDALGLTCTACHGGNPAATAKDEAHVRPRFSREWMHDDKLRIPERSGPLLEKESL